MKSIFISLTWMIALLLPVTGLAQNPIISPDVTADFSGTVLDDDVVGEDDLAGNVRLIDLSALPPETDLTAYHQLENGDHLLAFDTTTVLNGLTVEQADVARFDGSKFALEFDASANKVPNGVVVDALSLNESELVLSFDTAVNLGGITADDEDLVTFTGTGFELFFDGSKARVPTALDLNAAHILNNGRLQISMDGSSSVDGLRFDDEDLLEFDPANSTWTLVYDGSAQHAGWPAADLDALAMVAERGGEAPPGDGDGPTAPDAQQSSGGGGGGGCFIEVLD